MNVLPLDEIAVNAQKKGSKIKTSEARRLAYAYGAEKDRADRLQKQLDRLSGGEQITRKFKYREIVDLSSYVDHRGGHAGGRDRLRDVDMSFGFVEETYNRNPGPELVGAERHIDQYMRNIKILNETIQNAYNAGYSDGTDILGRLAAGTITADEIGNRALERSNT